MTLTLPVALFLVAGILLLIEFFLGFYPADTGRYRIHALALALIAFGLMLWKGGR